MRRQDLRAIRPPDREPAQLDSGSLVGNVPSRSRSNAASISGSWALCSKAGSSLRCPSIDGFLIAHGGLKLLLDLGGALIDTLVDLLAVILGFLLDFFEVWHVELPVVAASITHDGNVAPVESSALPFFSGVENSKPKPPAGRDRTTAAQSAADDPVPEAGPSGHPDSEIDRLTTDADGHFRSTTINHRRWRRPRRPRSRCFCHPFRKSSSPSVVRQVFYPKAKRLGNPWAQRTHMLPSRLLQTFDSSF